MNVPPLGGMILRRIGPSTFVPEPKEVVEAKPTAKRVRRASGPLPAKGKRAATQKSAKKKKRAAVPKASSKGKGKSVKANKTDVPARSAKGVTIK